MNDLERLSQNPVIAILVLVVLLGIWVWILKRAMSFFSRLKSQGPEAFLTALDRLIPVKEIAVTPQSAKAIREALAKKLRVPPEMVSSHTVRGQVGVYGVSSETIQILEQILRDEEAGKYGWGRGSPHTEITLRDVFKASRELNERLPKQ